MSGRHHNHRRGFWLWVAAAGCFGAALFVGGHEFATWEGHTEPVVKTRTVTKVPDACTAALADAVNGLELARRYDDEMRTLHEQGNGVHYFNPGDPGGHYDTAQQHHKDLTAARAAFERARALCVQEVPSSVGETALRITRGVS